ncbi:hypothetical protein FJTKL_07391 [Diaporthe vaccinii]|uniref:Uncharacterized protein n=1 Tax=Diaporthe vaccinii TaxID=105482 RepID=A0ABR4ETX0_9PEZI
MKIITSSTTRDITARGCSIPCRLPLLLGPIVSTGDFDAPVKCRLRCPAGTIAVGLGRAGGSRVTIVHFQQRGRGHLLLLSFSLAGIVVTLQFLTRRLSRPIVNAPVLFFLPVPSLVATVPSLVSPLVQPRQADARVEAYENKRLHRAAARGVDQ